MDPKVAYWTAALANMIVLVASAATGVRAVRRRLVRTHRRRMLLAAGLVGLFLCSYPFKLALLGREPTDVWAAHYQGVLRFHELCIFVMVAAGAYALYQGVRLGLRVNEGVGVPAQSLRAHRRAGWAALAAGLLGVLSASWVLIGMYARAGLL